MHLLLAGFDSTQTDHLSTLLIEAGYQVMGGVSRKSCRALVKAVTPALVITPSTRSEEIMEKWLKGVVADVPWVEVSGKIEKPQLLALVPESVSAGLVASEESAGELTLPEDSQSATISSTLEVLERKLGEVRFSDYFQILEVDRGASVYTIREQFNGLTRQYQPENWPHEIGPVEVAALQEILLGLADAIRILSDPELRSRYEGANPGASKHPGPA